MKRILQIVVIMMLCTLAYGGNVSKEQAWQKALQFTQGRPRVVNGKRLVAGKSLQLREVKGERKGFYAFNVGEKDGFVLVSADDRTPAILGYAEKGSLNPEKMPENLRWWLEEYEKQLSQIEKYGTVSASTAERNAVEPLIRSRWNQATPYWTLCPTDPKTEKMCYTGCEATAMAQIVNYYKYPQKTQATIPAYVTITRGISMPEVAPTEIDWTNMADDYTEATTLQQQQAVAKLMYLCGTSLGMDYTSSGSAAYGKDAPLALKSIFGYDENMRYAFRGEYMADDWNDLVYSELAQNRPVLYMGQSVGGGHAFVVDGYSSDNYFHVNWGWGGECDGFFLLSILNPLSNDGIGASSTTDGYSFRQEIVIGIQPPTGKESDADRLISNYFYVDASLIDTEWKRDSLGGFTAPFCYSFRNNTMSELKYEYGIGVYDQQEQLVETHVLADTIIAPIGYAGETTVTPSIGAKLPVGDYTIRGISRRSGTDNWNVNDYSDMWQVLANVSDTLLTLTTPWYGYDASLEILTPSPVVGTPVTIRAKIFNRGMLQHDQLYLMINSKYVAGRQFEVGTTDSTYFDFVFVPTTKGTHTLKLVRPTSYSYRSFASKSIYVNARPEVELLSEIEVEGLNSKAKIDNTTVNLTVHLSNNSTVDYDDQVKGVLYRYDDGLTSTDYFTNVKLKSGELTDWTLSIDGLENDKEYSFVVAYRQSSGLWKFDWSGEKHFTVEVVEEINEDMTAKLVNPSFEKGTTGWTIEAVNGGNVGIGGTTGNRCFEAWNNGQFDIWQEVEDLPKGVYEVKVQGFFRYLRDDNAWNAYQTAEGKINVPTYIYMNNSGTPFKNVFDESVPAGQVYSGNYYVSPDKKKWYPNDMVTSAQAFSKDMYQQSAYGMIVSEGDVLRIGVKGNTSQGNDSWAIWDNFQLIYHGFHANAIEPVLGKAIADAKKALDQMMGKSSYDNLTAIVEEAETAYYGADGEAMFYSLDALYTAQEDAQNSIGKFVWLEEALELLLWDINNYSVAAPEDIARAKRFYSTTLENAEKHGYFDTDLDLLHSQISEMRALVRMPKDMDKATARNPVECTSILVNPSFEKDGANTVDGWKGYGTANYGNNQFQMSALAIEFYQSEFDIFQEYGGLPNGYYRLTVPAFYRYGSIQDDYAAYKNGSRPENAYIYLNNGRKTEVAPLHLESDGGMSSRQGYGDEVQNGARLWVPNDMISSVHYFKQGNYLNECMIKVDEGYLRMGITKRGIYPNDWVIVDDFRLYYLGTEDTSGIASATMSNQPLRQQHFSLSGQQVGKNQKGLQIVKMVREDGTVVVKKMIKN